MTRGVRTPGPPLFVSDVMTMGLIEIVERLETRRLTLRPPRFSDAARLAELANDYDVVKMTGRMPFPYALSDAEAWVGQSAAHDPRDETAFVIDHEDHGFTGAISLFRGDDGLTEVGYWIGRPYWGRGFASEALEAICDYGFRRHRKRAIAAGHFADNPASGVVLEKCGFLYTGVVKPLASRARGVAAPSRRMIRLA